MSTTVAAVADDAGKKRKRTGKDRKQAKLEAEQAQARMAALIAAAKEDEPVQAAPEIKPVVKAEHHAAVREVTGDAAEADANAQSEANSKKEPESIAKRVPQALKAMHPLLKQAKTFETQRLIKKIKWSRGKGEDVVELEAQNTALSQLHLTEVALSHLRTKIAKHHLFKHQSLPAPVDAALSTAPAAASSASTSADAAERAKAENRLVSNKVVADGMKGILAWTIGEEGAKLVHRNQVAAARTQSSGAGTIRTPTGRKAVEDANEGSDAELRDLAAQELGDDEADDESVSDEAVDEERAAADAAGWESGSVDDLGDSEGDGSEDDGELLGDSDSDSDSEGSTSARPAPPKRAKGASRAPAVKTPPAKVKPAKPTKQPKGGAAVRENITSSLFLPSLASGFTRGDSDDSDPDMDYDMDGAGVIGKKGAGMERKNRRGQRARQAIWEKKYGKNAKHVVKIREADNAAAKEANVRNAYGKRAGPPVAAAVSSISGGAAGPADNARPAGASRPPTGGPTASTTAHSAPSKAAALHPSWEAARKKKQMLAAAPAAQKIVFD